MLFCFLMNFQTRAGMNCRPHKLFQWSWTIAAFSLGFTQVCDCHPLSHTPSPDGKCCRGRCLYSLWQGVDHSPLLSSHDRCFICCLPVSGAGLWGCAQQGLSRATAAPWLRLLRELRTELCKGWRPETLRAQSRVPSKVALHWCVMNYMGFWDVAKRTCCGLTG